MLSIVASIEAAVKGTRDAWPHRPDRGTNHTPGIKVRQNSRRLSSVWRVAAVAQTEDMDVLEPRVPPIWATVTVQGQSVHVKVDAGAFYLVINEAEFARRFLGTALKQSDVELRGYFGHQSAVVGKVTANAEFGGRQARLPLFVVRGGSWVLLGRNWVSASGMPLGSLLDIRRVDDRDEFMGKFPRVVFGRTGNTAWHLGKGKSAGGC